jgi:predicted nucleic acid-binding Zn ribbon protein
MRRRNILTDEARIPEKKLEQFLLDLVNAHVTETGDNVKKTEDDAGRIFHLYSKFLPRVPSTPQEAYQNFMLLMVLKMRRKPPDPRLLPKDEVAYQRGIVAEIRDQLRAVWTAGDAETAEWRLSGLYSLAQEFMAGAAGTGLLTPDAPPSQTSAGTRRALPADAPLSQALFYVWRKLGKLKKCPNPECPNTFFIAVREGQQCCSEECASVKRREYKKAWWRAKRHKLDEGEQPEGEPVAKKGGARKGEIQGGQPSMAEPDVKAFILDVVNADEGKIDDGRMYLFSRHPAFFPTRDRDIKAVLSLSWRDPRVREQLKGEFPRMYHRRLFRDLRDGLRNLWQSEDESTAAWMFFRLQSVMHSRIEVRGTWERTLRPPLARAPVHQALRWVRQHLSKLRKCGNPECPRHPFFVADRNERFCSEECAKVGQRASKRRSWGKHGQEWRRKQGKGKGGPKAGMPNQKKR